MQTALETGVPAPSLPLRRDDFGAQWIERILSRELGVTASLSFGLRGVCCRIVLPLSSLSCLAVEYYRDDASSECACALAMLLEVRRMPIGRPRAALTAETNGSASRYAQAVRWAVGEPLDQRFRTCFQSDIVFHLC